MLNMVEDKVTNYRKINLREFRHKFTELKDSINSGQIYQVTERGNILGYFVPNGYDIVRKGKKKISQDEFTKIVSSLKGKLKLRGYENKPIPEDLDYRSIYRKHLEEKYLNK